ncbi:(3R)-3-hydroxyacyl-CoA dehydrogenase [Anopheles nili]|uniref:(3R)-3-hydroxyacyl-CoA dehydrogenase n=1 Tax=Anopheles nili TaxID=185578 RepID=UPI00237B0AAC|nr:(3R)-3-hydroxyacyl-CoA dehydrogenase [Anopheles nili]XP_053671403.1 (3R)-3-hydroxyacyl-CoA dehydrogenase [Anopheles nili]
MAALLTGKLALVTGAGSGIGRATSKLLTREGAIVVAVDRNVQAAVETVSLLAPTSDNIALEMDVASGSSIDSVLQKVLDNFKRPPSVIINAAGITRDNFLLKMPETDFDAVINVNLKGTWLVLQKFGRAMIEHNVVDGSMVNVSSIVARSGNIGQSNYSPSKAGVEAMTKVVAREFGRYNIRVNAIVPGFIHTPMTETVPQKVKDMMIMQCALRRFGVPAEIAEVAVFLGSNRSSYVNGTSIEVTGG